MQQAIVDKLNDQIIKHTMFSRFAGYVTVEHTEVGQWLPRGEPVAEIIAIDEVDLLAKVPESQIPFVHLGDQVEVQVPALVGRKMAGKIQAIIPEADERSRTFPVKIRITNEMNPQGDMLLKAGMMARVMLPNNEADKVTMVSKDALVLSGATPTIWSIDEASIEADAMQPNRFEANAISIPVRLGREAGDWIEVIGDVSPGALVVKTGNERIPQSRPGAPPSRVTWTVSTE